MSSLSVSVDLLHNLVQAVVSNPGPTITALGIIAGGVYYRLSNLETPRNREQYIVNKFEGRRWDEEPLMAEFDTLTLIEADGFVYKLRRYVFGQLDGEVVISVNANFAVDEEMWTHEEFMKLYHEVTECEVEFLQSKRLNSETVQMVFRMSTIDEGEISHAIFAFLKFIIKGDETFEGVELGRTQFER
jgi:hypothetical protein